VYPPVAKESVHKGKKINGIRSVPWDDDGDEGRTGDWKERGYKRPLETLA
jgi:hypothetical protein